MPGRPPWARPAADLRSGPQRRRSRAHNIERFSICLYLLLGCQDIRAPARAALLLAVRAALKCDLPGWV